ncbi:MAG: deiodinase family protein [Pirellula sp.]
MNIVSVKSAAGPWLVLLAMAFNAFGQVPVEESSKREISPTEVAEYLEGVYKGTLPPEGAKMLMAIVQGSQMRSGEGWFGPAQSRFDYAWLCKQCNVDDSKKGIPRSRFPGSDSLYSVLDRNRDGMIQAADLDWSDSNPYVEQAYMLNRIFRKLDKKGDGAITREEWLKVFEETAQLDEELTAEDFSGTLLAGFTGSFSPGDRPDTAQLIRGLFAGEIGSMLEGPKVGQPAPLFRLKRAQQEGVIDLSDIIGDKPLVLVFGNFTCGPFRAFYPAVDRLYEKYRDQANFLMVYVREAHPSDGWKMESNTKVGVDVSQPTSFDERIGVANQFCIKLNPKMPVVVDELNDPAGHAYSGMPARLYVIDAQGKVAFKSGRGPFGFSPPEMEQALAMSLLEFRNAMASVGQSNNSGVFEPMSDDETWKRMPPTLVHGDTPLPNWAKIMAKQLPRTTAAMLQLDYIHRTQSPLDPKLRAKMRLVIAMANRCDYSKNAAIADLVRVGGDEHEVEQVVRGPDSWAEVDRSALRFAQLHTLQAPSIEDSHFEELRARYGVKEVAAMVLLGAYGNFQDRVLLGLNVQQEGKEPLPPLQVTFAPEAFQTRPVLPANQPVPELITGGKDVVEDDGDWGAIRFEDLQVRVKGQMSRKQRLPTPTWEEVAKLLPPDFNAKPTRIVWNLVCMGYVPELALPWSTTTRTMWVEAPQDRTLEESLFWVQTRAIECNYCMGHCEMLLGVAGHNQSQIDDRLRRLASNDWSAFPEKDQRAYAFARTLTKTPWAMKPEDFVKLEKDYGERDAMAIFFWLCRGLYMTRVSDGFALQLESDNVFADFAKQSEAK